MNHFELMKLPFIQFCAYVQAINKQNQYEHDKDYFNGSSKLTNAWQENKDKWGETP